MTNRGKGGRRAGTPGDPGEAAAAVCVTGVLIAGLAMAAAALFPALLLGETVVGIDLGTTFSCVAVCQAGTARVVPVEGRRPCIPSAVTFDHPGGSGRDGVVRQLVQEAKRRTQQLAEALEGGKPRANALHLGPLVAVVGAPAAQRRTELPAGQVAYDVKRVIGRSFHHPLTQLEAQTLPYRVLEDPVGSNRTVIALTPPPASSSSSSSPSESAARKWAPEELSALVLRRLKESAEASLGVQKLLGFSFTTATVSVPAEFDVEQRRATEKAALLAGFKVTRLVEEPVAAAVAYDLQKSKEPKQVLVFDFGGGTLDVALLYLAPGDGPRRGTFLVKETAGDAHLGGEDFDRRLAQELARQLGLDKVAAFMQDGGHQSSPEKAVQGASEHHLAQVLLKTAEQAKIALDHQTSVTMTVNVTSSAFPQEVVVTRELFEKINAPLLERMLLPIHAVLNRAGVQKSEVDDVVLVGGSTLMACVRERVGSLFDDKPLNVGVDPDTAIALGAARFWGCG
mmetsp:Transcript_13210/g.48132  ORF Transcript_13210/g.48132 Transcript_13210/m.48132 type:complete len:511 (+) Transcript_13210:114-1646(+)